MVDVMCGDSILSCDWSQINEPMINGESSVHLFLCII